MTTVKNFVPQSFILSESFPNEEGIRAYFSQNNDNSFYTSLEEKNKEKTSTLEKSVETTGNSLPVLNSSLIKNNKEYILQLRKEQLDDVLDHSTSTIVFTNVSNELVNRIQSYELHYQITRKEFNNELRFWLSPTYVPKELSLYYLDLYTKFANLKDTLQQKYKVTDLKEIKRLMPSSYGINAVITTGIKKWQEIITKGTRFSEESELRYVLINLSKNFRHKHATIFSNMSLEDKTGKRFGFDSLKSSDDAWLNYRIIFI